MRGRGDLVGILEALVEVFLGGERRSRGEEGTPHGGAGGVGLKEKKVGWGGVGGTWRCLLTELMVAPTPRGGTFSLDEDIMMPPGERDSLLPSGVGSPLREWGV